MSRVDLISSQSALFSPILSDAFVNSESRAVSSKEQVMGPPPIASERMKVLALYHRTRLATTTLLSYTTER